MDGETNKVGEKLICINDEFPAWARATYKDLPVKNQIYTYRGSADGLLATELVKDTTGKNPLNFNGFKIPSGCIYLKEIVNEIHPVSKKEPGFLSSRFVPVEPIKTEEKSKISIGKGIKKPKKITTPKRKVKELQPI